MLVPKEPFTRIIFHGSQFVFAETERYKSSPRARELDETSRQYQVSFFSLNSGRASHNAITTVKGPLPKSKQTESFLEKVTQEDC